MAEARDTSQDARFVGTIPDVYERLLVPMIFEAAATSLAATVAATGARNILETAAGTGALTRALVRRCPGARITATDLNQPMLDAAAGGSPADARVTWRRADALDLPFEDDTVEAVVCQFGVMFFPDRVRAYREARRVLEPGGSFVFNVWDTIEHNEIPQVIESALRAAAPKEPLEFMSRVPHGYSLDQVRVDLEESGMTEPAVTVVDETARTSASEAATAFCHGTPLRIALEAHPSLSLAEATLVAERALLRHFGEGPISAPIRSFEVVSGPA